MSVRVWLSFTLFVLAGCRSHSGVCEGAECADPPEAAGGMPEVEAAGGVLAGGAAGAGDAGSPDQGESGADPGSSGAGGAATCGPECDNGVVCDGIEFCDEGVCKAGEAPSCTHGTECVESSPLEPCVYTTPSPWMLLLTAEQVLGLPTSELGQRELLVLGERASTGVGSFFYGLQWSPDGRRVFSTFQGEPGLAVDQLDFGAGLPGPLHKPHDVPDWGDFGDLSFSMDGSRALLNDRDSGTYLLELDGQPPKTSLLEHSFDFNDRGGDLNIAFCDDAESWIDLWLDPPARVTPTASGLEVTSLGGRGAWVSPDGRLVFVSGDDSRLLSCASGGVPVPLGVFADDALWSPQSSHVLIGDGDTVRIFSVEDPLAPVEIWSHSDVSPFGWSPDGTKLVVQLAHDDTETLAYVDVKSGQSVLQHDVLEHPGLYLKACGNHGCVAWREPASADGEDLVYVPYDSAKPAQVLFPGTDGLDLDWVDCDRGNAVIEYALESSAHQISLLRFDETSSSEQPLFESSADSGLVTVASDASGIAVKTVTGSVTENVWVRMPMAGQKAVVVPLGTGDVTTFQPWP